MLTRSISGRSAATRFWRLAPRILAVSYLIGAWYITVTALDTHYANMMVLYVLFAPVYLLVGPWMVLDQGSGLLPLILVYGALAAYFAWRQLIAALQAGR